MKKVTVTWANVESMCHDIIRQIQLANWKPDYVVGLNHGGLVPATLISQYLCRKMETLKVRLGDVSDSNLWMASDAYDGKNILIIDDINDTGSTLSWIKQDWQSGYWPTSWDHVWGKSTRVATLYDNEVSKSELAINYSSVTINTFTEDCQVEFPWENWWNK
jgi:hypoxanthine phosphoribosyltransferase